MMRRLDDGSHASYGGRDARCMGVVVCRLSLVVKAPKVLFRHVGGQWGGHRGQSVEENPQCVNSTCWGGHWCGCQHLCR